MCGSVECVGVCGCAWVWVCGGVCGCVRGCGMCIWEGVMMCVDM